MTAEFWANRFHHCALIAGFIASDKGRLADCQYVQQLAYDLFESGVFRNPSGPNSRPPAVRPES